MPESSLPPDIVFRLRARDESAYRQVVEAHFTRLARFAFKIVGSYDVAEDIVQAVLVKISEQGMDFNPQGSLLAYLYTAVRNRSLNVLRNEGREHLFHDEILSRAETSTAPDSSAGDMDKILELLTERQRTVMRLRFVDGLTIPEIARILEISITSTNRLIARGLEILRKNLRTAPEG